MAIAMQAPQLTATLTAYRHLMRLEIEMELAVQMVLGFDGRSLIKNIDVPDDLTIVSVGASREHFNTIEVLVHSETFPELTPGQWIPLWNLTSTTYRLSDEQLSAILPWEN